MNRISETSWAEETVMVDMIGVEYISYLSYINETYAMNGDGITIHADVNPETDHVRGIKIYCTADEMTQETYDRMTATTGIAAAACYSPYYADVSLVDLMKGMADDAYGQGEIMTYGDLCISFSYIEGGPYLFVVQPVAEGYFD